jgi:hypothetical protein
MNYYVVSEVIAAAVLAAWFPGVHERRLRMYERFTDEARAVMQSAKKEAQRFNHEFIGTEHILLGLITDSDGQAGQVLKTLGVDLRTIRLETEKLIPAGPSVIRLPEHVPLTPRAKSVIAIAGAACDHNRHRVKAGHLLIGLLAETEGVAAQVLMNLGLKLEEVREEVWAMADVHEGTETNTWNKAEALVVSNCQAARQRAELGVVLHDRWQTRAGWPYANAESNCLGAIEPGGVDGLDHSGFVVLGALRALTVSEGGATLGELAEVLGYLPLAVRGELHCLEHRGWVERA